MTECNKVGLQINAKKTKGLLFNIQSSSSLHTLDGTILDWIEDFRYLGSWVESSEKDISVRKALAWLALNGMSKIWKSDMDKLLKVRFFIATIESILLYGCETWTLTESMERSLNGTYTRMLRKVLNYPPSYHIRNSELYGKIPLVTDKIASRRLKLAGHCYRHPELSAQPLVLWEPTQGRANRGRPRCSFISNLKRDTGAENTQELAALMKDRRIWKSLANDRLKKPIN